MASPYAVAQSFIKAYYEVMNKKSEELHLFYKEDSSFSHFDTVNQHDPVTGLDRIKECITSLNFDKCKLDLTEGSLDAQCSGEGTTSVVIVVTGHFTAPTSDTKPFVQTFLLVSQNLRYFVRNSIFRTISIGGAAAAPAPPVAVTASPAVTAPKSPKTRSPRNTVAPPAPAPASAPSPSPSPAVTESKSSESPAAAAAPAAAPVVAIVSQTAAVAAAVVDEPVPFQPKSWADRVGLSSSTSTTTTAATVSSPTRVKKEVVKTSTSEDASPTATASASSSSSRSKVPPSHVVFIKNYPDGATKDDFSRAFSSFGAVVKVDLSAAKKYAWVDFDSEEAASAAIAAVPAPKLKGQELKVESRTKQKEGGNNSGGGGGGAKDKEGKEGGSRNRRRGGDKAREQQGGGGGGKEKGKVDGNGNSGGGRKESDKKKNEESK